jgi:hypothetical protein
MSNENDSDYLDPADLEPVSTTDPDAAALEAATQQAAEQPVEQSQDPAEENTDVSADGIDWAEFDDDNEHVTLDKPAVRQQKINPNTPSLNALKIGEKELEDIVETHSLTNLTDEQIEKLSSRTKRAVSLMRNLATLWQELYYDGIDKSGDWHQTVQFKETTLGPGKVRPENIKDPIQAIRAQFGQGTVVQVPLWSTGIWLTFRAPTLQSLLDFEQKVRMEKSSLGRSSNGMVFSASEVYTVETYMAFCLEHVTSVTYELQTGDMVDELMDLIRITDYQSVIWGLLMASYPDGYPFRQPCVADPDKCDHVDEMILNFSRMGFVDRDKLTDAQKLHMASRRTKRTLEQIEKYQSDFPFFEQRVKVRDGLTAVLGIPTLHEQAVAGHMWVDGIATATDKAFGKKLSDMDRARHIMRSGAISNLRQYSQWIRHFEYQTDPDAQPQVIDNADGKDRLLEMLSESVELATSLNDSIVSYFRKTAVSYIAIPKIKCPSCQGESYDKTHPYLIPIDIGYVFFTLAALKINQIENVASR